MNKFLCLHKVPGKSLTEDQIKQLAVELQRDPMVRGYRSFFNLSKGRIACVVEAPDSGAVAARFKQLNIPYDEIIELEYEGDRGTIHEAQAALVGM